MGLVAGQRVRLKCHLSFAGKRVSAGEMGVIKNEMVYSTLGPDKFFAVTFANLGDWLPVNEKDLEPMEVISKQGPAPVPAALGAWLLNTQKYLKKP